MTQPQPLDLDAIDARRAALNTLGLPGGTWTASPCDEKSVTPPELSHVVEDVLHTSGAKLRSSVGVFGDPAHADFVAHAREDVPAMAAEIRRLRAELAELKRPAVEAKRNEIRQSFTDLIAQCEQDRDYEGAFDVQCRLREREEQWKTEDAAAALAACPGFEKEYQGVSDAKRRLANCKHCGQPRTAHPDAARP
jgi:DNA repair exonuclease SbcCD ATPase subunit